ncbi:MAG TPA: hypothetical protein VGO00_10750, partial [Kofleriaceae bacterium]|nr:hypothetical protein [Kofleriaceae bacterium]
MTPRTDLVLSVLHEPGEGLGFLAGFAITDKMIIAAGGVSNRAPTFLASSNARHFESRKTPRELGLRDVLAIGEVLWTCGEYGQLAVSRDHGASWKQIDTTGDACLYGLAEAHDGAVWVVGDRGYAARVVGDTLERVDLGTTARLTCAYARKDELVVLGFDGVIRRWRNGTTTAVATGSTKPLTALAWSRVGTWIVVGDGGFVGRSPDGTWFSKVKTEIAVDLEAIATLTDGRLVAVGDRGVVAMSADEGRSWKALASGTNAHLWAVEAFGGGAIIGGDDGLVVKIAPADDETWSDRVNVFGGAHALDTVFGAGPDGF